MLREHLTEQEKEAPSLGVCGGGQDPLSISQAMGSSSPFSRGQDLRELFNLISVLDAELRA